MKKFSIFMLLALCFIGSLTGKNANIAVAETAGEQILSYEHLTVYVMPQYSKPEEWVTERPPTLIGIHGTLVNHSEETFTNEIIVSVPENLVDFQFSRAGHFDEAEEVHDVEAIFNEETNQITWQVDNGIAPGEQYPFVVEYYFSLDKEEEKHIFTYPFPVDRNAKTLNILFFEPYGANSFMISEDVDQITELFETPVHVLNYQEISAGTVIETSGLYYKDDSLTTVEAAIAQAEAENAIEVTELTEESKLVETIVLSLFIILIIIAFIFFIWRSKKKSAQVKEENTTKQAEQDRLAELQKRFIRGEIDKDTYEKEKIN